MLIPLTGVALLTYKTATVLYAAPTYLLTFYHKFFFEYLSLNSLIGDPGYEYKGQKLDSYKEQVEFFWDFPQSLSRRIIFIPR